jgi:hypothetical protein
MEKRATADNDNQNPRTDTRQPGTNNNNQQLASSRQPTPDIDNHQQATTSNRYIPQATFTHNNQQ